MAKATHAVDVLALLHQQHLEVEELFQEMERLQPEAQGGGDAALPERRAIAERIVAALMRHANAEEELFYPALRSCGPDGDRLAEQAMSQHRDAEQVSARLDGMSPDCLDFDGPLRELIADVRAHVAMEEAEIFPRIEAALPPERRLELGAEVLAAMERAPTRPHPRSPSPASAPGRVMGRGAAVLDRLRDAVSGRPRD